MSNEKLRYVILYTAGIALLVFVINRVLLGTNMQSSLMWTALFAAIAFAMAWRQAKQKKL
jgi:Flp pilus assembly protein TadB